MNYYKKGTTLEVKRIGCKHLGVATGDGNAIHNSKKEKRVVESPLFEFADGEQIFAIRNTLGECGQNSAL